MSHTASTSLHRTTVGIEPPTLDVLAYEARARGILVPEMIRKLLSHWAAGHPQYRSDLARSERITGQVQ